MHLIDIEQGSFEWHKERQGCVTGTTLASALGSPKVKETLMYKLVSERMTEPQIGEINVAHITRANEMESVARKAVIDETGVNFTETGMIVSDEIEHYKVSPDAIFIDNDKVVGGLEIKCPDSKKHVDYLINKGVPKEYWHQVYAPFLAGDEVEWWMFASFDDRNYEQPLTITTVFRDDLSYIADDRQKLQEYLATVAANHAMLTF